MSLRSLLVLVHLIGLAFGVGAATAKVVLLLRCRADRALVPSYLAIVGSLTKLIVTGLVLLTLTGVGFLLVGYPLQPWLVAKIVMVVALWAVGPVIDKVYEPRFRALAPAAGETASEDFAQAERSYFLIEAVATGLFYVIVVMWVLQ